MKREKNSGRLPEHVTDRAETRRRFHVAITARSRETARNPPGVRKRGESAPRLSDQAARHCPFPAITSANSNRGIGRGVITTG